MKDELNDQLRKLGLRLRPRKVEPRPHTAGQIAFDERGNAVYEWKDARLGEDSQAGETARRKALEHPGLSIVDDEAPASAPIRSNPKGLRVGYNPYESGMLAKKEFKKKRDLHALSKWVQAKRKAGEGTEE